MSSSAVILIVDDEETIRFSIKEFFEERIERATKYHKMMIDELKSVRKTS